MKWLPPPSRKTPYLQVWRSPLPQFVDARPCRRHTMSTDRIRRVDHR